MKRLLGIGEGKGIGEGMGTGEGKSRRVRFDDFIDYIQTNYRMHLNSKDYEFLEEISENYFADEVMKAIEYCKSKKSDSLIYLRDALSNKYYENQSKTNAIEPKWLNQEINSERKLTKEDKMFAKYFYNKYCATKEEYKEKLEKYGLE